MTNLQEIWKAVNGYEGLYEVSNKGRVKTLKKPCILKKRQFFFPEKVMKQHPNKWGYPMVSMSKDGIAGGFSVHRLVAIAFIDNPENKPQVNHIDGNKLNNYVSNLEWATRKENMRHSWDIGLRTAYKRPQGEGSTRAKLTNDQAREIRASDLSHRKLAKVYGVNHSTIADIKKGIRYKEI